MFGERWVLLFDMNAYRKGDCATLVASVAFLSASTVYSTSGAAEALQGAALGAFDLHVSSTFVIESGDVKGRPGTPLGAFDLRNSDDFAIQS
jgi:hypothetical protein